MTATLSERQAQALRQLRDRFRATRQNTLDAFRQLAVTLADSPTNPELLDALRRELHRVHGTAGSYGYQEASRLAGVAEQRAIRWAGDENLEVAGRAQAIQHFTVALDLAFRRDDPDESEAAPAPVESRTVRAVAAVALTPGEIDRLRADAADRGYRVASLAPDQAPVGALREIDPIIIVTSAEQAARLADAAWMVGAPLVVADSRPRQVRSGAAPSLPPGVLLLDTVDSFQAVFDVAERAASRNSLHGAVILSLDDDPMISEIVRYVLGRPDVSVHTISDPTDLMSALERVRPSLLLMDISMPGRSGIELTRDVRTSPAWQSMPIVLLSGDTDTASREEALLAGADEFVSKPISVSELRSRVTDRLERLRLERLSASLHPLTGLPAASRALRESQQAFEQLLSTGSPVAIAVLKPRDGELSLAERVAWQRECVRVAAGLGPASRFAGHLSDDALLLVLALPISEAASQIGAIADGAPDEAPDWRAGLSTPADLPRAEFTQARRAAEEAVDVARTSERERVHRWVRDEAMVAPDVIVVEDDPALSDMLQYALRATGFTWRAFGNGRVALEYLLAARTQDRRPIVLLDVDLPGMDGYSLHERLSVDRPGDYAVVFVTVHGSESDQLRALRAGAIDFVIKPLNLRILLAKMASWMALSRTDRVT